MSCNHIILIMDTVDLEPIQGTPGAKWQYTLLKGPQAMAEIIAEFKKWTTHTFVVIILACYPNTYA